MWKRLIWLKNTARLNNIWCLFTWISRVAESGVRLVYSAGYWKSRTFRLEGRRCEQRKKEKWRKENRYIPKVQDSIKKCIEATRTNSLFLTLRRWHQYHYFPNLQIVNPFFHWPSIHQPFLIRSFKVGFDRTTGRPDVRPFWPSGRSGRTGLPSPALRVISSHFLRVFHKW